MERRISALHLRICSCAAPSRHCVKPIPDTAPIHLARAEAYRQQSQFKHAESEYQAAMKLAPNDVQVHLALAEAQYRLHRYEDSLATLKSAVGLSSNNSI